MPFFFFFFSDARLIMGKEGLLYLVLHKAGLDPRRFALFFLFLTVV